MNAFDVVFAFERLDAAIENGLMQVRSADDVPDPNAGSAARMNDVVHQALVGAETLQSIEQKA